MNTPAPYTTGSTVVVPNSAVVQGTVVEATPTAFAGAKESAVFKLGQVLKTVLHKAGVFVNEQDLLDALDIVDRFVGAFVPGSAIAALATGAELAAREDVTLRTPPNSVATVPVPAQGIDYDKLAAAIFRVQQAQQQQAGKQAVTP